MGKSITLAVVVAVLTFLTCSEPLAQKRVVWRGGGGWGAGAPYSRMFNPQAIETIRGQVITVDRIKLMKGMNYGIHLVVKTEAETISVHLGPGWFIENQEVKIEPKDMVEVRGSRTTYEGKSALIAAEVKRGDEVLTLRDQEGFPAWSGWRSR